MQPGHFCLLFYTHSHYDIIIILYCTCTLEITEQHVTRFIALAQVGNPDKKNRVSQAHVLIHVCMCYYYCLIMSGACEPLISFAPVCFINYSIVCVRF